MKGAQKATINEEKRRKKAQAEANERDRQQRKEQEQQKRERELASEKLWQRQEAERHARQREAEVRQQRDAEYAKKELEDKARREEQRLKNEASSQASLRKDELRRQSKQTSPIHNYNNNWELSSRGRPPFKNTLGLSTNTSTSSSLFFQTPQVEKIPPASSFSLGTRPVSKVTTLPVTNKPLFGTSSTNWATILVATKSLFGPSSTSKVPTILAVTKLLFEIKDKNKSTTTTTRPAANQPAIFQQGKWVPVDKGTSNNHIRIIEATTTSSSQQVQYTSD